VVLEPIMSKLSAHQWFISEKKSSLPEEAESLKHRISQAKLNIIAELGSSHITVSEFLGLSVGDVISLNKEVEGGLSIKVGDRLKFIGSPGTLKDRVAVQIDEIVSEGVEEFDE
jgi:flagellar motor switch protein FliM